MDLVGELLTSAEELDLHVTTFERYAQLADSADRKLTAFGDAVDRADWQTTEVLKGKAYEIECRWEDLFCTVIRSIAARVPGLWIVDGNEVIHRALELDPRTIQL